jgi:hypothetical protein
MKKIYGLLMFLAAASMSAQAQDEGNIVKRERISLDNGVFFGIGPSFTLGKNIGDYSTGINVEVGYTKRLNRVLSIGPSLSYLKFNYDAEKTGVNNFFYLNETIAGDEYDFWPALYVNFDGGDMTLVSLAATIKLNLIPVMDESKISIYAFAKPFVTSVTRTAVKGEGYVFGIPDMNFDGVFDEDEITYGALFYSTDPIAWEAGPQQFGDETVVLSDDLKKDSRITGGIFIGPGIEINPAKKVSVYAQAAFGYTFPVSFISTKKYKGNDLNNIDEKYPVTEEGFPSVNLQFGVSFNF